MSIYSQIHVRLTLNIRCSKSSVEAERDIMNEEMNAPEDAVNAVNQLTATTMGSHVGVSDNGHALGCLLSLCQSNRITLRALRSTVNNFFPSDGDGQKIVICAICMNRHVTSEMTE